MHRGEGFLLPESCTLRAMVQIRELQVRLNRGDVLVRYRAEGVGTQRIRIGWWLGGIRLEKSKLNRIEHLIVETLIHAAVQRDNGG